MSKQLEMDKLRFNSPKDNPKLVEEIRSSFAYLETDKLSSLDKKEAIERFCDVLHIALFKMKNEVKVDISNKISDYLG